MIAASMIAATAPHSAGRRSWLIVMVMPRIGWVEDDDAIGPLADMYAQMRARSPTGNVPPILRTMSLRPDFLSAINQAANLLHFQDGALTRAQHEMIASYVAALNRCHY